MPTDIPTAFGLPPTAFGLPASNPPHPPIGWKPVFRPFAGRYGYETPQPKKNSTAGGKHWKPPADKNVNENKNCGARRADDRLNGRKLDDRRYPDMNTARRPDAGSPGCIGDVEPSDVPPAKEPSRPSRSGPKPRVKAG